MMPAKNRRVGLGDQSASDDGVGGGRIWDGDDYLVAGAQFTKPSEWAPVAESMPCDVSQPSLAREIRAGIPPWPSPIDAGLVEAVEKRNRYMQARDLDLAELLAVACVLSVTHRKLLERRSA